MQKKIVFILIVLILGACRSTKNFNDSVTKVHSKEDLIEDVDFLVQKLERYHPRLYDYISQDEFYKRVDALKNDLEPMTSHAFFLKLYPLVSEIKQGHLALRPVFPRRDRKERKRYRKAANQFNDIDFVWINDGIYIENTFGEMDSLLVGSRLLKIDSLNADAFMNTWKTKVASDGFNTTFQPQIVADNILTYYRFQVGRTDSINLQLQKKDSVFNKPLKIVFQKEKNNEKEKDSTQTDTVKKEEVKLSKAEKKKKKKAFKEKRKEHRKTGYSKRTDQRTRDFRLMGEDSSIAYLRIRSFKGWYKWSKRFYRETFAAIDSIGCKHLILDLKDNTGGSLKEIGELYGFLANENFTFLNPMETKTRLIGTSAMWSGDPTFFGAFFKSIGTPIALTVDMVRSKKENGRIYYKSKFIKEREPKEDAFKGEIFVLTNGLSFSASSILSTNLHGSNRATFIGEETGGAYNGTVAGIYQTKYLPNSKLFLPLWMMNIDAPYKTEPNGYGIQPDVIVTPKLEDLIKGKDTVLEWTVDIIEEK